MDTGSVKPAGMIINPMSQRNASSGVPSQLPPERAVQSTESTRDASLKGEKRASDRALAEAVRSVKRSYSVDQDTGAFVFQATQEPTGDVLVQYPSQEILKLRAYLRETLTSEGDAPSVQSVA
jgi:uncharacterized FlaG/YvyC family protein